MVDILSVMEAPLDKFMQENRLSKMRAAYMLSEISAKMLSLRGLLDEPLSILVLLLGSVSAGMLVMLLGAPISECLTHFILHRCWLGLFGALCGPIEYRQIASSIAVLSTLVCLPSPIVILTFYVAYRNCDDAEVTTHSIALTLAHFTVLVKCVYRPIVLETMPAFGICHVFMKRCMSDRDDPRVGRKDEHKLYDEVTSIPVTADVPDSIAVIITSPTRVHRRKLVSHSCLTQRTEGDMATFYGVSLDASRASPADKKRVIRELVEKGYVQCSLPAASSTTGIRHYPWASLWGYGSPLELPCAPNYLWFLVSMALGKALSKDDEQHSYGPMCQVLDFGRSELAMWVLRDAEDAERWHKALRKIDPKLKLAPIDSCAKCGAPGSAETQIQQCRRCRCIAYCSPACQRADWERHRIECTP